MYIVVKGTITLTNTNGRGIIAIRNRLLVFKYNVSFTNCISKINNVLIGNAEDLDVVISMYNLLEYSKNYRKTTGSLLIILLPPIIMQTQKQILSLLNIKVVLQEKHQMQIKKKVKTLSEEIQRLRKILKLLFH